MASGRLARKKAPRRDKPLVAWDAGDLAALSVHEARLPHLVPQLSEPGEQAHLFGDVIADQPEVDDVTAAAKLRHCLNE